MIIELSSGDNELFTFVCLAWYKLPGTKQGLAK